jgi:hypothetical protein
VPLQRRERRTATEAADGQGEQLLGESRRQSNTSQQRTAGDPYTSDFSERIWLSESDTSDMTSLYLIYPKRANIMPIDVKLQPHALAHGRMESLSLPRRISPNTMRCSNARSHSDDVTLFFCGDLGFPFWNSFPNDGLRKAGSRGHRADQFPRRQDRRPNRLSNQALGTKTQPDGVPATRSTPQPEGRFIDDAAATALLLSQRLAHLSDEVHRRVGPQNRLP